MKLEKAKELLQLINVPSNTPAFQDYRDAIKLGIEALKLELLRRQSEPFVYLGYLPGETEE